VFLTYVHRLKKGSIYCWCLLQTVCSEEENNYLVDTYGLLIMREERRLRVFENRVLRRIFGPKRDEVKGERKKLHNEELKNLYSSPHIVLVIKWRGMRWAGHEAHMWEGKDTKRVLVEKHEGRRLLGRPRHRW
jgi:hypothetical protein